MLHVEVGVGDEDLADVVEVADVVIGVACCLNFGEDVVAGDGMVVWKKKQSWRRVEKLHRDLWWKS